ncbi:transglycosylase domain-containing protein [Leptothermofonsia sp. ETS-13]|uniref:transglycosylase domain-containing protein n=1 Tax=Leptothermofonsia sp. ETS-13 TaxID=3035696 RepID=UPI003BA026B6
MDDFLSKIKKISSDSNRSESLHPKGLQNTAANRRSASASRRSRRNDGAWLRLRRVFDKTVPALDRVEVEAAPPNHPRGRKPLNNRRWFWLTLLVVGGGGTLAYGVWSIERGLPDVSDISSFTRNGTLTIQAADGSILQQIGPATREKLTYEQIPPKVVQAFIAAEDRRFYQHNGVDFQSIVRAIATNLLARDVVEGGSTITQQLARVVYLSQERSLWRKVQEAFLAQKIEREMSKQQVLERYLNLVYLGSGAYGVADAAWVYFSKSVDQLTLPEIATIAGLPPAPSDYSPLVNLDKALQRRNVVLERMQEAGYISEAEAEAARSLPLQIKPSVPKKLYSDTPYFTSYIQQQLSRLVSKEALEIGGLTVETTLNPIWQKAAEKATSDAVKNIGPYEGFQQAALVSIDPSNGEIRAMVGGTDFRSSQFNRVTQAQRQPGSAFKTILYTTAIATGMSPWTSYLDAPYYIDGYKPENYNKKYSGWLTLREALTNSVNIVSVKLLIDIGFDPVIKMAREMGIKSKLLPTYSLALGASEVNLLELTSAYGVLANGGKFNEPHGIRRILDRKGNVIYNADFKARQVVDQNTVAIVTWMMQGVVNSGTGQTAQLGDRPVAGKTGTSENSRDLWFVGFIPQVVTGVWLGNDNNSPTWSASSTAAEVWHNFMVVVVKGMPVKTFADLPPNLGSRKGSIKAKPVRPNRTYIMDRSSEGSSGQSSGGYYSKPTESPAANSTPVNDSSAPPPEDSATPAEPPTIPVSPSTGSEPLPPPPAGNSVPPELPPSEPTPPPASEPSPSVPPN